MLIIINSAKTQHYMPATELPSNLPTSQPVFLDQAETLAEHCRSFKREDLKNVMKISDKLVDTTIQRFEEFALPHVRETASPALATFAGEIFAQIHQENFSTDDFLFADRHLRILSGLYGMLRPLDLMMPYRLEMGYKMSPGTASSLDKHWAERVTHQLNEDLQEVSTSVVLNLASREYSQTVLPAILAGSMVTVTFKQRKDGTIKNIAVYSKRARGMFVDWFVANRIERLEEIRAFDRSGYRYVNELSSESEMVFLTNL